MNKKKFAVIVNPVAGRGRTAKKLPQLQEIAANSGHQFNFYYTEESYHAARITDKIHREYDAVVAFGGDGTANEVINGLAGTTTPFGIIPEGTGNDFARTINVARNLQRAIDILINYNYRLMDLGTIDDRIFINGVGIGFDGFVNYRSKNVKLLKGSLAYLYAVFSSLALWKCIPVHIEIDDSIIGDSSIYLIAVGNGWSVGGGLKLTPEASIHDGLFDICRVRDIPTWKILLNFAKLKNGTLAEVREVTMTRGKRIRVSSEMPLPIHFDGEVYDPSAREVNISIVPQSAFVIGGWSV
ncbi:MAG: diacylglycerol kinase family lipid kinase [Candidatus Marinimicrobia bacterium]|nr:diacylglycerol kinase family lipid kinase [Candidatus Neomarinimicrobiota bacterium]